jgi:uncharacterized membrane protein (UPF0127 family)
MSDKMILKDMEIKCNGNVLATKVYVPESIREQAKGAYGKDLSNGNALMYIFEKEHLQVFDMMWMKKDIGYICLDKNHTINKFGIMKHALFGVFGSVYPMPNCMIFIETNVNAIKGINIGDEVTW